MKYFFFKGHDHRLERTLESVLMVMEALDGYSEKFKFEIYGHSGEESALPLVKLNEVGFFLAWPGRLNNCS